MPIDLRKPNDEPIGYKEKDFLSRILEGYHPLRLPPHGSIPGIDHFDIHLF